MSEKSRNSLICSQAHLITLANYISHDNYIQYLNLACYFLFRVIKTTPMIGAKILVTQRTFQMVLISPSPSQTGKEPQLEQPGIWEAARGRVNHTAPSEYSVAVPAPHLREDPR